MENVVAGARPIEPSAAALPASAPGLTGARHGAVPWRRGYALRLCVSDAVIVATAVVAAQAVRFGDLTTTSLPTPVVGVGYPVVSALIAVGWLIMLALSATRDHKIIGNGVTEYKRVADASLRMFGLLAIAAFALRLPLSRGYLLIALPLGLVLLLVSRWAWRSWLHHRRTTGGFAQRAVIMGERSQLTHVARQIRDVPGVGIHLVGAITDHNDGLVAGLPAVADYTQVVAGLAQANADTLIFCGADTITPQQMRELGWELEAAQVDLIVAPALTDVAGPRIHARPVAGLPLIYVDYPTFEGTRYATKRIVDVVASALGLIVLAPLLALIAWLVHRDGGPVLFRQERVGLDGQPFTMLKFRSMIVDAEQRLDALRGRSDGNAVLFKMRDDPRITPIGRILRRYSLDELPQLVNVLLGDMSLVGPRPPLRTEVDTYADHVHRRFLVRPGITGLWQVSGRSDLSWDDSVRLDLSYVENWSLTGDLIILLRTTRAVLATDGAY